MMKRELMERTMCLGAVLMIGAFIVFGCGDAAENAPADSPTTEMTEAVIKPTEPDTQADRETELQAKKGPAEPTELPEESEEPEEEVLFRIAVFSPNKREDVWVVSAPSNIEYDILLRAEIGTCFDVYEIVECEDIYTISGDEVEESALYYRIKTEDGRDGYVYTGHAQIIE